MRSNCNANLKLSVASHVFIFAVLMKNRLYFLKTVNFCAFKKSFLSFRKDELHINLGKVSLRYLVTFFSVTMFAQFSLFCGKIRCTHVYNARFLLHTASAKLFLVFMLNIKMMHHYDFSSLALYSLTSLLFFSYRNAWFKLF